MDEEAANGRPEPSNKARRAFKGSTGAKRKHDGLGGMATWTTPGATRAAHGHMHAYGHSDVEDMHMVSDYTESASSKACGPEEFDEPFRARAPGLVQELNQDPALQGHHGTIIIYRHGPPPHDPPSTDHEELEVHQAVKSLRAKMHKPPGIDGIHN